MNNSLLNKIKKDLLQVEDTAQIKNVVKTIDKNLSNNKDWEFFEEAFNNADKDFLHKIKDQHPNLTPSDLKLCAYLRLNLSSKEIAPLLNISIRSVEIKRYRLRKKMDLEHEDGLVDYILSVWCGKPQTLNYLNITSTITFFILYHNNYLYQN